MPRVSLPEAEVVEKEAEEKEEEAEEQANQDTMPASQEFPQDVSLALDDPGEGSSARMTIRQTWGKHRLVAGNRIVTYFLLGITTKESDLVDITFESQKYRDIIQKDFMDSYYNLTLKTMMGIEWVHIFCSQSRFVMKTDTDMFVNIFYLSELLLRKNRSTRFFTGFLMMNERPIRDRGSKWKIVTSHQVEPYELLIFWDALEKSKDEKCPDV
nr:beta-1,3-galactosyltransferase 5-like [Pelodiscus sinensis]|eukprot:XP_025042360.1 beta-1,3-galactosyltransferase 5-like [Pelodiscus sinensis]